MGETQNHLPNVLTIAGSDSGGGAGIQADMKSISANGAYAASVLTALTAQNTLGMTAIHDVPISFITAQMDAVYGDLSIAATKIGMLSQAPVIETVADGLRRHQVPNIVLDPVMVSTNGDLLLAQDAVAALIRDLVPLADVITPNLHEAAVLIGTDIATSRNDMVEQARLLLTLGAKAVLLKGGHFDDAAADDFFASQTQEIWLRAERVATSNSHGTGCTLSSAIAAHLAHGADMLTAAEAAKAYLTRALAAAHQLNVGQGAGPVHHFHNLPYA